MPNPANRCMFKRAACPDSENGHCESASFIACEKWYEITCLLQLCPLMLKEGYRADSRITRCDLLKLRTPDKKCFSGNNCLPRKIPNALTMINKS